MIPKNIKREHIIKAIEGIKRYGTPERRNSRKFLLEFDGKLYPPKYVVALANKYANGKELSSEEFGGGRETNDFLINLGFKIIDTTTSQVFMDKREKFMKKENYFTIRKEEKEMIIGEESVSGEKELELGNWIGTVILQSSEENPTYKDRLEELIQIIDSTVEKIEGDGIILFPAGWFNTNSKEARTLYEKVERDVSKALGKYDRNILVCVGIDGRIEKINRSNIAKDQIGIAVSKRGIEAIGRKFHPTNEEKGYIQIAGGKLSKEEGKSRIFELNGKKYYICVCYDIFGIKHLKLVNPGVDFVLNLIHRFNPKGAGGSGEIYFAKHGLAGASKQWNCPAFGAVVFFNRSIPENWPSGVYWTKGEESTQYWSYRDNPVYSKKRFRIIVKEGIASVRIYL